MKALIDFWSDYKRSVKPFWQEEPLDYLIYRPLAFVVVKGTYSFPLVPNHFSLLALATALVSGLSLAKGTPTGLVAGGIGVFLFGVWDCCDGMLARMKGGGDHYGQFVDMLVDVLSSLCVYGGLAWGLKDSDTLSACLVVVSGMVICVHAGIYNFYKKQFFFYRSHNPRGRAKELKELEKDLERLRGERGTLFKRFLVRSFLLFTAIQKNSDKLPQYDGNDYVGCNQWTLGLWGVIAGSSHLGLLAFSLIFSPVDLYLGFALVFSNLWLALALIVQWRVNAKLKVVGT